MRNFCHRREIALFDRVIGLNAEMLTAEQLKLGEGMLEKWRFLEEIKLSSGGDPAVQSNNLAMLQNGIPPCRLAELKPTGIQSNGISIPQDTVAIMKPGQTFACTTNVADGTK